MTQNLTIEQLWAELRKATGDSQQRRIDADHPHDLYADYELPDRPGFVVLCPTRPTVTRSLRAVEITEGLRADGRWSLRLSLNEPALVPVFAALCRDIVAHTKSVQSQQLSAAVLHRIERWRNLLARDSSGFTNSELQGLIGELLVLEFKLLSILSERQAVTAWTGPLGSPQDFVLPSGQHLEVKTIDRDAGTVQINGLGQLDAGADSLALVVVRVETTGVSAQGAVTAPILVSRLRARFSSDSDTLNEFDAALASFGWHDDASHELFALRPVAIDEYEVSAQFPRLVRTNVPSGVQDAVYVINVPRGGTPVWRA